MLLRWKRKCVRGVGPGMDNLTGWYIRFTPNVGGSLPWFRRDGQLRRLRFSLHHGLQIVRWTGHRWYVEKQVLGSSRVRGERYL